MERCGLFARTAGPTEYMPLNPQRKPGKEAGDQVFKVVLKRSKFQASPVSLRPGLKSNSDRKPYHLTE